MRRPIGAWAVLAAMACTPSRPTATGDGAPPMPEPVVAAPVVPDAAPTAGEDVRPELVIGVLRPNPPSETARKANGAGLKRHEAGDHEDARARFAEAIAADPEHDMARFNLACALARLGRHDEAAAELETVLTRDPARFRGRVGQDPDLASLRGSPRWTELADHLQRAEASLDGAFDRGVPAMYYAHTRPSASWGTTQQGGTRNLVVGLYLHDTGRFVPLSRGGEAGYVDLAHKRVVRVASTVWEGVVHTMWRSSTISVESFAPGDDLAASASLDTDGTRAVGHPDLMKDGSNAGFEMSMILVPVDEGVWLDLEWHTHGGEPYAQRTKLELTRTGLARTERAMPPQGPRLEMTYDGAVVWDPLPAGHRVQGRSYQPPDRDAAIELSRGHRHARWQSVALDPEGRFAFVTSIEQRQGPRFEDTGEGILRHAVDRVDLQTGEVRSLAEGPGTARTVIGPEGAVYVQSGDSVRRFATAAAIEPLPLPEGLRLAPPLDALACDLCG